MIELVGVTYRVERRPVLRDVSFVVGPGATLGITGANGAGKSLLLAVCATLVRPERGVVRIADADAAKDPVAARRLIGYLPEEIGWAPRVTVREDLELFAGAHGLDRAARRAAVADALTRWRLDHLADERVERLSRGLLRRLGLARAWLHRPRVLLLDDPAAALDPESESTLWTELARHGETGGSAIVVAYDGARLARVAPSVAALVEGELRPVVGSLRPAADGSGASEPPTVRSRA